MRVLVTGFFDMLHSGHVRFFERASEFGEVHVALGSDAASWEQKNKFPVFNEIERLYLVSNCKFVTNAFITARTDELSFVEAIERVHPDCFVINTDGNNDSKKAAIESFGIKYVVLDRDVLENCPARSSSNIRRLIQRVPYRCNIGGFVDQPKIGKLYPCPIIVFPVIPEILDLDFRSGMATSTREKIKELYNLGMYPKDLDKFIELVFCYENPPFSKYLSGTIDPIGTLKPGIHKLNYDGDVWPKSVKTITDDNTLDWLEDVLWIKQTHPRPVSLGSTIENSRESVEQIKNLNDHVESIWSAIQDHSVKKLGISFNKLFDEICMLLPDYAPTSVMEKIMDYRKESLGVNLMGAGGGGYTLLVSESRPKNSLSFKVVR